MYMFFALLIINIKNELYIESQKKQKNCKSGNEFLVVVMDCALMNLLIVGNLLN